MPRPMEAHRTLRHERGALRPLHDIDGLLLDARNQLGKAAARKLASDYPDLTQALGRANWTVAREAIDDAHTDGLLTDEQHQAVIDLAAQHNVPLADSA